MDKPIESYTEIEARLGRRTRQGFDSSCGYELLDGLLRKVQAACPGRLLPWTEFVDYQYTLDDGRCVRTRAVTDESACNIRAVTVHKRKVANELLTVNPFNKQVTHVRLARSDELEVDVNELPHVVPTKSITRVCIKQRASLPDGDFRYDFTLSWEADTREAAEAKQRDTASAPVCYVELEYVGKEWPQDKNTLKEKLCKTIAAAINAPTVLLS